MNKTEKEYYKKCLERTGFGVSYRNKKWANWSYPTCVYFDTCKQRCELNFCYREVKEKGAKA